MTTDQIAKLLSQIHFLQKQTLLNTAKIQAAKEFLASLTEQIGGLTHHDSHQELNRLTRLKYEKLILEAGDSHPEWATSVDIRPELGEVEKQKWEYPEEG